MWDYMQFHLLPVWSIPDVIGRVQAVYLYPLYPQKKNGEEENWSVNISSKDVSENLLMGSRNSKQALEVGGSMGVSPDLSWLAPSFYAPEWEKISGPHFLQDVSIITTMREPPMVLFTSLHGYTMK